MHQSHDVQPTNARRINHRASLHVVKENRHGQNAVGNFNPLVIQLGDSLQIAQNHPQQLLRRKFSLFPHILHGNDDIIRLLVSLHWIQEFLDVFLDSWVGKFLPD
mmetsp:Transcript_1236/g.3783  ORF Transcript_1236/g.3783 Transcript_1236/m.3783 type:complete len:105 (+) Transcript_1236:2011-2325(+)